MRSFLLAAAFLLTGPAAWAARDDAFEGRKGLPPKGEGAVVPAAKAKALNPDDRLWITAPATNSAQRTVLVNAGVSIEEVLPESVGGIATPEDAQRLRDQGILHKAVPLGERFRPEDFPKEDAAYHNYKEAEAELKGLAAAGRGLASLFSIGRSGEGKDIWCLRLNTSAQGEDKSPKPGIVFMGTHHAREHLSTEIPLLLAKHLVENRAKPDIAALLETRDIYIIPMVNPDGVEFDLTGDTYHMHRKNTRKNTDGSVGVDLNRNYGFHWAEGGASPNPRSDIYHGPSAFSEPETMAVRDFVEKRKDSLKVLLSYHTFSELILYPWGHSDDPIPDAPALAAYKKMASAMAQMTGYKPQQSSQLYIASGDTTDWSWGVHKIFSFTFELTPKSMWNGGFYPGAAAIQSTFQANLRPALYLIGLADDPLRATEDGLTGATSPETQGGR